MSVAEKGAVNLRGNTTGNPLTARFYPHPPDPCLVSFQSPPSMEFGLLSEAEARSPALSLSDAGTPHPPLPEHSCKGQEHSGERTPYRG